MPAFSLPNKGRNEATASERVNKQKLLVGDVLPSLKQLFLGQVRASAQLLHPCTGLTAELPLAVGRGQRPGPVPLA